MDIFLELLKYAIPAFVVFLTSYYLVNNFLKAQNEKTLVDLQIAKQKVALPIRLQAYERLALFLERITLAGLIHRVRRKNMSAQDLQLAMLQSIRLEFDHNVAQQVYVSPEMWMYIIGAKEQTLAIVNRVGASLPKNATNMDFSQRLLQYFGNTEEDVPTEKALLFLKSEVKNIF